MANDHIPLPPRFTPAQPFEPQITELRGLERKLHADTYSALFAERPADRLLAHNNAHETKKQIEQVLDRIYTVTDSVHTLLHSAGSGNIMFTVAELLRLIDPDSLGGGEPPSRYRPVPGMQSTPDFTRSVAA